MNTLNLGSDEMPEKKKKSNTRNLKIALGLAAVILVPTIGSTLAGTIQLNSGASVEFGQGVVTTAACDPSITVTPSSALVGSTFIATSIAVTGLANASCNTKTLTIKALNSSNVVQLSCAFVIGSSASSTATTHTGDCNIYGVADETTGFVFRPTEQLSSAVIEKITLESSN
jgi:hypothetical protein